MLNTKLINTLKELYPKLRSVPFYMYYQIANGTYWLHQYYEHTYHSFKISEKLHNTIKSLKKDMDYSKEDIANLIVNERNKKLMKVKYDK